MNGRFSLSGLSASSPETRSSLSVPWWVDPDAELLRLLAALAFSCLLHAAVTFLPFLGKSVIETRLALKGSQKTPPVISAILTMTGEHRFATSSVPPATAIEPAAAAVDRPTDEEQLQSQTGAEGADLLPIPALGYYTTDQLSKRPQPVTAIELDSAETRAIVVSGKIILKLWINEFGSVADVEVETSELPEVFSRAALAAFRNAHFTPGERNGSPVGTVMRIEVSYDDGRLPQP
jgi:TonB family protein